MLSDTVGTGLVPVRFPAVSYQIIPDAGKVLDGGGSYWEESSGEAVHYIVKNTDRLPYPMTKSYDKSSLHIKFK